MADEMLLRFLAEREAKCPVCAYALRGLRGDLCPECGVPLALTVGTSEPRLGVWLLGLVSIALPTGFFCCLGMWIGAMKLYRARGGPGGIEMTLIVVGMVVGVLMLAGMIRLRPRFRKLPVLWRWVLIAVGTVLMWGLASVFIMSVK